MNNSLGFRCGTLNVGTYTDKEDEILDLMKRRKIDVLGMAETRQRGSCVGKDLGDGFVLMHSGMDDGVRRHGVALIFGPKLSPFIQQVQPVNERLISCTIRIEKQNFNILQVYAPQQGHTQNEKDEFMEMLELHLEERAEGINILLGDFNARVGRERSGIEEILGPFGEETKNTEGENLIDFCVRNRLKIMNGFFKHQDTHKYTRYRWNQNSGFFDQKSIIDYIIVSDRRIVKNIKVFPGESMDSDHRLVIGDLKSLQIKTQKEEKRKIIKVENLKNEDLQRTYRDKVTEQLQEVHREDRDWDILKSCITTNGQEVLGHRFTGGTRKRHTPWWNEEVKEAIRNKNTKLRRWLKGRSPETREEYVRARNNAETVKRSAKKDVWIKRGEALQQDLKKNKKMIFGLAKAYRKEKTKQYNIKDEIGNVITEADQLNEKWTSYFKELLNRPENDGIVEDEYHFQYDIENREESLIQEQEFRNALKSMKIGKSPGCDGISIELIREGGELVKECLLDIFNQLWLNSTNVEDWAKIIILPFYKNKGDSSKCENYRGISLLCHAAKLYEHILEKRARAIIEPKLGEEQYGYRADRSTSDLIFTLRMVIEKSWEFNKPLYVAFIDLEKAFDSVPRYLLWKCLDEVYGVNGRLGAAIQSTYTTCKANVRTGYKNENWFDITAGVKQGSVLSPLLFIAYMDTIIKNFKEKMNISGDIMIFADDIAFWTDNKEELEQALQVFNECIIEAKLKMNIKKTEILTVDKGVCEPLNIQIGSTVINNAESSKYLGCKFTNDGNKNKAEINERIVKYNKCAGALYPIMKDQYVPDKVKITIFEGLLTPILMYGSESWTVTSKEKSRIQATEMKTLRTISKKTRRDRIRNETIRNRLKVAPLMKKIEKGQLRWLGHLERMDEGRVAKRRWNWRPEGRRSAGRPRKRWIDGVEEILKENNLPNIRTLRENDVFNDRMEWRKRLIPLTG